MGSGDRRVRQSPPGSGYRRNRRYLRSGSGSGGQTVDRPAPVDTLALTYTAKPFAGLLDLVERRVLPPDEPVCAIHTGGVPALFAQASLLR